MLSKEQEQILVKAGLIKVYIKEDTEEEKTLRAACLIKVCTRCRKEKVISEYEVNSRYADGFRSQCKQCRKEEAKVYFQRNKSKIQERTSQYQKEHPHEYWSYSTRCGHTSRGCTVLISTEEMVKLAHDSTNCHICGELLNWDLIGKNGSPFDNSPTLDRMNQEKVLTLQNVQVICSKCNVTKNARTMQEFIDFCRFVTKRFEGVSLV